MKTFDEFVQSRLHEIFDDLAERLSEMDLPDDVAAGVPFALFKAELHLKTAWAAYIRSLDQQQYVLEDETQDAMQQAKERVAGCDICEQPFTYISDGKSVPTCCPRCTKEREIAMAQADKLTDYGRNDPGA